MKSINEIEEKYQSHMFNLSSNGKDYKLVRIKRDLWEKIKKMIYENEGTDGYEYYMSGKNTIHYRSKVKGQLKTHCYIGVEFCDLMNYDFFTRDYAWIIWHPSYIENNDRKKIIFSEDGYYDGVQVLRWIINELIPQTLFYHMENGLFIKKSWKKFISTYDFNNYCHFEIVPKFNKSAKYFDDFVNSMERIERYYTEKHDYLSPNEFDLLVDLIIIFNDICSENHKIKLSNLISGFEKSDYELMEQMKIFIENNRGKELKTCRVNQFFRLFTDIMHSLDSIDTKVFHKIINLYSIFGKTYDEHQR